jgi:hypothetical protein
MRSMTAQPNARVRLRRAIERRALWLAEDAARELPNLSFEDALQLETVAEMRARTRVALLQAGSRLGCAIATEHDVFSEPERRRSRANLLNELLLGVEALRFCIHELIGVVVVLEHVELDLGLKDIETSDDGLLDAGLRVRKVFVGVLRISEDADMSTMGILSMLLRDGMQVEHRPAGDEKLMDVAQGVHDALTFDSSQGPGEEREVEAPPRGVDLGRADGSEGDAIREVERQSRAGSGDLVGIGIDGENACSRVRVTKGQPAVTAPKLEHTEAVQRRNLRKRVGLGTLGIDPLGHARIMADPARRSRGRAPAAQPRHMLAARG